MHTGHTRNLRGFAYRERDVTNWRAHQGAARSITESTWQESTLRLVLISGQCIIDAIEQGAHLIAGTVSLAIHAVLFV
jgi:hypothetical protein